METVKQQLLRKLPSISDLLNSPHVEPWLREHPHDLVTDSLRQAVDTLREQILADGAGRCGASHVTESFVLQRAEAILLDRTQPHVIPAINATGVILHTALGRAVWPETVVDDMIPGLKGYVTLAVDRETGLRSERDNRVEAILCELTGAEAATVVNNNAGATLLVLAALAGGREVIVSRGQLIEIGGAFRLPDVMSQGGAKMVEVGTTNRTHLRDYENAITEETALLFRAHPSNFRVVGFTKEVPIDQLAALAGEHGLLAIDDLGAGALVDLGQFGLPHEPTARQSLSAGADVVLFSGDKLIGGPQAGIIAGNAECIRKIRKHPLARALRPDKTCLMALERTLAMFRDVDRLKREHPLYRMLSAKPEQLATRAETLAKKIRKAAPDAEVRVVEADGYLGSGSCPMEALPGRAVSVQLPGTEAGDLARALRLDEACVFSQVSGDATLLHVRTMADDQFPAVADATGRVAASP